MKEQVKIEASVASHKGNLYSKNEEKFYLNGQYMDLNQQKDSTSKSAIHNYKQSVYGIASGTKRGALGEQAAFITIEVLSRYHLYLEENSPSSFALKKQRLIEELESARKKIESFTDIEQDKDLGVTVVGLVIDGNKAFGFSVGEEGIYKIKEKSIHQLPLTSGSEEAFIGSEQAISKILRTTEEFSIDVEDRYLLTSKGTYDPSMEKELLSQIASLSTKESTKAFIKELLNKVGQKNLTALLVYVEALEGIMNKDHSQAFVYKPTSDSLKDPEPDKQKDRKSDLQQAPEEKEKSEEKGKPDERRNMDGAASQNSEEADDPGKENKPTKERDTEEAAGEKELSEDQQRHLIFEQRYAENQLFFNKKPNNQDYSFIPETKGEGLNEETGNPREAAHWDAADEQMSASEESLMEESLTEEHYEEEEDGETPWRTRSKFLLVALLAVGVILMAFVFGTIRSLEQRILDSSISNIEAEETGQEPDEALAASEEDAEEEPIKDDPESGEEDSDETAIDESAAEEEEPESEESVEDEESTEEATDSDQENMEEETPTPAVTEEAAEEEAAAAAPETAEAEETHETYAVQGGDTIFSISRRFYNDGSMVDEIIRLNNIQDINNLQVGDVLRLPNRD